MSNNQIYLCSKCDAQFPKWAGRCEACGAWGSIKEEDAAPDVGRRTSDVKINPAPIISFADAGKFAPAILRPTGLSGLDLTLGGGLVDGSITLVAGEPGIGKSTLLAQLGLVLSANDKTVLYVTGEESPAQIKRRLDRLSPSLPEKFHFLDETAAEVIAATIEQEKPDLTIIDSIQSLRLSELPGEAGSVGQVKACAATLAAAAKQSNRPIILVGQVTKEGDVAGPRVLEHVVDTVLFLEGERNHHYRLLRALKHRFGPTDEVALLAMTEKGLEPVLDISSELMKDRAANVAGSIVTCLMEGHRPALIEIQALITPAGYGTPVRRTTGIDSARLGMLLAVLARRAGINALDKDVYVNAAGGMDARDPSIDLAIAFAIAGALKNAPLDPRLAVFGEIGLGGEVRPISLPELRLKEMARLGFTQVIVPKGQSRVPTGSLRATEVSTLNEALKILGLE
jgi:DNA repair protein RadA/Sms